MHAFTFWTVPATEERSRACLQCNSQHYNKRNLMHGWTPSQFLPVQDLYLYNETIHIVMLKGGYPLGPFSMRWEIAFLSMQLWIMFVNGHSAPLTWNCNSHSILNFKHAYQYMFTYCNLFQSDSSFCYYYLYKILMQGNTNQYSDKTFINTKGHLNYSPIKHGNTTLKCNMALVME